MTMSAKKDTSSDSTDEIESSPTQYKTKKSMKLTSPAASPTASTDLLNSRDKLETSFIQSRSRKSINQPLPNTLAMIENDDEAELSSRRKSLLDRRKSIGLGRVAQMPESQLEERMKLCIQLNTENKINVNNAFKLEMIDILACMVKRESSLSNLQVASSSLDVSSKIYGLRVDKIHNDVHKMLGAMEKQENDQQDNEENEEEKIPGNEEDQLAQKKKRKRKKGSVFATVESLRGNIDTISINSLMMQDEDPQTSDMFYQTILPLSVQNLYYMMNPIPAIDQLNLQAPKDDTKFLDPRPKFDDLEKAELTLGFPNFRLLGWSVDEEGEVEREEVPISENQLEKSIFQFDLDASLPPDAADFEKDDMNDGNVMQTVMYLTKNIARGGSVRMLEYSYVPTNEIIHWAGPSYWKIKVNKNATQSNKADNLKSVIKKKELVLEFTDGTLEEAKQLLKFSRNTQLTAKTTKGWSEDKLLIADDLISSYDPNALYKYYLRPNTNISVVQDDLNTTKLNDNDDIIYDYNNALDASEYCPDVDSDNADVNDQVDEGDEGLEKLVGNNLVEMPNLVGETYIPYSKRAKKLDIMQLKKSIWKTLKKNNRQSSSNDDNVEKEENAQVSFSTMYQELPSLLNKNNLEALSVSVCFVSLLHLANEKSLFIEPNQNLSDLTIKTTDGEMVH